MNIFFVDRDPGEAARALCDKHVGKMLVESCQMLASVYHLPDAAAPPPVKLDGEPYRRGYWNHPSQAWVRRSLAHWRWLHAHALALASEHVYRFGTLHGGQLAVGYMAAHPPLWLPDEPFSDPPQCVGDAHRGPRTVAAYRAFYAADKARFARWTRRAPPRWWPGREHAA